MYTKKMPWDTGDTLESVMQAINKPPRDILKLVPKLDKQIAETIMEGLEQDPDNRWQSAAEMADEFREAKARLEKRQVPRVAPLLLRPVPARALMFPGWGRCWVMRPGRTAGPASGRAISAVTGCWMVMW
jgi:hypothetical protein